MSLFQVWFRSYDHAYKWGIKCIFFVIVPDMSQILVWGIWKQLINDSDGWGLKVYNCTIPGEIWGIKRIFFHCSRYESDFSPRYMDCRRRCDTTECLLCQQRHQTLLIFLSNISHHISTYMLTSISTNIRTYISPNIAH